MKLTASVKFDRALRKFAAVGGDVEKFVGQQVRENARLLVSSSGNVPGLVQVTPPFHQGAKNATEAKKTGEKAVLWDIRKVYAIASDLFEAFEQYGGRKLAVQFWKMAQKEPQKLETWIRVNGPPFVRAMQLGWDEGAEHRRRRRNGVITGGYRTALVFPHQMKAFQAYVKMRQRNVGLLASAMPAAYNGKYGPLRGVPGWAKRHQASWGAMKEIKVEGGVKVRLTLRAPYAIKDMQRRFTIILGYRRRAMGASMPKALRALTKKLTSG